MGVDEVHLAPLGIDGRHGLQLVEQLAHLAIVGIGQHLALDAPEQLAADLVEVGEVGLRAVRVEGEPGKVHVIRRGRGIAEDRARESRARPD